jgi:SAM-dependent methyltransferase
MLQSPDDKWAAADAYELFMGRWSRQMAERFVHWLGAGRSLTWLDVGCGTGALTEAICKNGKPAAVVSCDRSAPFVEHLRAHLSDERVSAVVAAADDLPRHPDGFDRIVSGLVFNFLPDPLEAVRQMRSRLRPEGVVAAYVWDYAEGMEFLRVFWDEAVELDPGARDLDEGKRFPICRPEPLQELFLAGGLTDVRTEALEIATSFASFDDYWQPFSGNTGPAPGFVVSLDETRRNVLRGRLERRLPTGPGGTIDLKARAWAVRGTAS